MKPVSPAFSKQLLTLGSMLIPPKAEISPKTRGTWSVVVVNIVMIVVVMSMIKMMAMIIKEMMMMIMGPGCSLQGEVQASFGLIFAAGLRSVGTCLNVEKMQNYIIKHNIISPTSIFLLKGPFAHDGDRNLVDGK